MPRMKDKHFKPYEPDQSLLLPPNMNDWLPEDHLVFVQESPKDEGSCLAEVRSYVFGADLGPRDLGVELDATNVV